MHWSIIDGTIKWELNGSKWLNWILPRTVWSSSLSSLHLGGRESHPLEDDDYTQNAKWLRIHFDMAWMMLQNGMEAEEANWSYINQSIRVSPSKCKCTFKCHWQYTAAMHSSFISVKGDGIHSSLPHGNPWQMLLDHVSPCSLSHCLSSNSKGPKNFIWLQILVIIQLSICLVSCRLNTSSILCPMENDNRLQDFLFIFFIDDFVFLFHLDSNFSHCLFVFLYFFILLLLL